MPCAVLEIRPSGNSSQPVDATDLEFPRALAHAAGQRTTEFTLADDRQVGESEVTFERLWRGAEGSLPPGEGQPSEILPLHPEGIEVLPALAIESNDLAVQDRLLYRRSSRTSSTTGRSA